MAKNEIRWEKEAFATRTPPDDIQCKDCRYKMKNVIVMGNLIEKYKFGKCDKFEVKPNGILFRNELCPEYERDVAK